MKQGLSKREKIMLLVLGLLALLYVAWQFAFVPLYDNYTEAKMERDRLRLEREILELKILRLTSIEEANKLANDEYADITKDYPLLISNDEIDTLLTNLVLGVGMDIRSIRIFPAPSDADSVLFTIMGVTMSLEGSYTMLLHLLDEVEVIPNISITTMSFSENRNTAADDAARGTGTISIGFELMYITPQE